MTLSEATVLLVDDELELLEIFSIWLRRSGCKVLTAANGAEALKVLGVEKVDALISDIRMPIVDGVTLVRRIYDIGIQIPSIIFVSGFGDVDPREMHALGVELMIEKPISRQRMLHALESSLREREELWLTQAEEPVSQRVEIEFGSLDEAGRSGDFKLGRGGCCFRCAAALEEEKMVELAISFAAEGRTLRAHGEVRWYRKELEHAGVAFTYLDPECRGWVIEKMKREGMRSFIPMC
jgi:CheY-like chemotaxis protein